MNSVIINEWDADLFHNRVLELERQGYVMRRETYRITPEMNPETGLISHLYTIEMLKRDSDEAENKVERITDP